MRKITILVVIFLISIIGVSLTSCTGNSRAKKFGGTHTVTLDAGDKLLEGTWKRDNLWLLTRKRRANETIETYKFQENSSFGIMEGTIIIKEK